MNIEKEIEEKQEKLWEMERHCLIAFGKELAGKCFSFPSGMPRGEAESNTYSRVTSYDETTREIEVISFFWTLPRQDGVGITDAIIFGQRANLNDRLPDWMGHAAQEISEAEFNEALDKFATIVHSLTDALERKD